MPPKAKVTWKAEHAALLQKGFQELGWDPTITAGKDINSLVKTAIREDKEFEPLLAFFSVNEGGKQPNNNKIYGHYKEQGSEYYTRMARAGFRSTCCCLIVMLVDSFVGQQSLSYTLH